MLCGDVSCAWFGYDHAVSHPCGRIPSGRGERCEFCGITVTGDGCERCWVPITKVFGSIF